MAATTTNAAGMPVSPVVWKAVGITPAATGRGPTPASTKNSTAGTPSRSRARARDTGLPGDCFLGMGDLLVAVRGRVELNAMGEQGAGPGGLGLGDQLAKARAEVPGRLGQLAAGVRGQVRGQVVA